MSKYYYNAEMKIDSLMAKNKNIKNICELKSYDKINEFYKEKVISFLNSSQTAVETEELINILNNIRIRRLNVEMIEELYYKHLFDKKVKIIKRTSPGNSNVVYVNQLEEKGIYSENKNYDLILYIDDFIGTGNQCINSIKNEFKSSENEGILIICDTIMENGKTNIKKTFQNCWIGSLEIMEEYEIKEVRLKKIEKELREKQMYCLGATYTYDFTSPNTNLCPLWDRKSPKSLFYRNEKELRENINNFFKKNNKSQSFKKVTKEGMEWNLG